MIIPFGRNGFFKNNDLEIFKVKHVDTHGGSLRVFVKRKEDMREVEESVRELLEKEKQFGVDRFEVYEEFGKRIYAIKDRLIERMREIKREGKRIVGYGAPAKATTALNFYGINREYIDFIVGPGFYIECEDERAKKIIDDFLRDVNFDSLLRAWCKEALIKGNGFIEIGGARSGEIE